MGFNDYYHEEIAPLIADFDALRADATRRMKKIGIVTAVLALPMIGAGWYLSVDWLLGLGVMIGVVLFGEVFTLTIAAGLLAAIVGVALINSDKPNNVKRKA